MRKYLAVLLITCAITTTAYPQKSPFGKEVNYITEVQANFSNGKHSWNNALFLGGSLPIDAIGGWKGGKISVGTLSLYRTAKVRIADDIQVFSNIDDRNMAIGIFIFGYTHIFNKLKLYGGVRNINLDYFVTPYNLLYTGSSAGAIPTLSLNFPLANFATSAVCAHVEWQITDRILLKNSLYNGVAHDQRGNILASFTVNPRNDGLINITEVHYLRTSKMVGFYSLGSAIGNSFKQQPNSPKKYSVEWNKLNYTVWGNVEQSFYRTSYKEAGFLFQGSIATHSTNNCREFLAIGGYFQGFILKSKNDKLGFYCTIGSYKDDLVEKSLELTWRFPTGKYTSVQTSFHFINTDSKITHAALVRLYVSIH